MRFSQDLIFALDVLKRERKTLIHDFLVEDHDIFVPMYKYENNIKLMNISIDAYFTRWLNSHFLSFECQNKDKNVSGKIFYGVMKQLISKFVDRPDICNSDYKHLVENILKNKIIILQDILKFDSKLEKNYNKLMHSYEKDKAIFERELKFVQGANNGDKKK